ncbi:hypothetical protein OY671_005756 [Metschnikowia pulcherrima]|nr:hypothetical protein OY671_005756 [Metschnikowia pulcherrima]
MSLRRGTVPATNYKEPHAPAAPVGLASSILNGNTADGGLRSITYKAVYASQLIEELDMARRAVVPGEFKLTEITDKICTTPEKLAELKAQTDALAQAYQDEPKSGEISAAGDEITRLNSQLDADLRAERKVGEVVAKTAQNWAGQAPQLNQKYAVQKLASPSNLRRMEDVPGFDSSIYVRAAQRRQEEAQQKAEYERQLQEQADREAQLIAEQNLADQNLAHSLSVQSHQFATEPQIHLPEPQLDELSYAVDNDVSMTPAYADTYLPQHPTDALPPLPHIDSSYLHSPGPQ